MDLDKSVGAPNQKIRMAVFDVAGTTARDDGLVVKAFRGALQSMNLNLKEGVGDQMIAYVKETMGHRKLDVFKQIFEGDIQKATHAHELFISQYLQLVKDGELEEFNGVQKLFDNLRESGVAIGITTGFPRVILNAIIDRLAWSSHIDFSVSAEEVKNGRPAPDMILRCVELYNKKFHADLKLDKVAVIGDTKSDMQAGVAAGAKFIVGVRTGAHNPQELLIGGATHLLNVVANFEVIC
jgi:phosphonatase-like hydrolase